MVTNSRQIILILRRFCLLLDWHWICPRRFYMTLRWQFTWVLGRLFYMVSLLSPSLMVFFIIFIFILNETSFESASEIDKSRSDLGNLGLFVNELEYLSFGLFLHFLHPSVQFMDYLAVPLTKCLLEIACSFHNEKLILLAWGSGLCIFDRICFLGFT